MTALPESVRLLTVGHSNQSLEAFLAQLHLHGISAIADVRSSPFSQYNPQFNREILAKELRKAHVQYVFLGAELGARRDEPECYRDGKARYDLIAKAPAFVEGLDRIRQGTERYRIAMMCAEKDPLTCHRTILVCRQLRNELGPIFHILEEGELESHEAAEERLLAECRLPPGDLFSSRKDLIDRAYDLRADRIAYTISDDEGTLPDE